MTDVFRDRVVYSEQLKDQLTDIRYDDVDVSTKQQALFDFEVGLAAIQCDNPLMENALPRLVSLADDVFQPRTTVDNLKLILGLRKPGENTELLEEVITVLTAREKELIGREV